MDDPTVERISPDSVSVNGGFLAKIFLADKEFKLVDAYVACETVENATVDTVINTTNNYKRLDGCKKGLIVKDDTIHIFFRAGRPGRKTFEEITILTRDKENLFRTQQYTFDYIVTEH